SCPSHPKVSRQYVNESAQSFSFVFPAANCITSALENMNQISLEFRNLAKVYRDVITDTCHKMGVGMAEFLEKRIKSLQDLEKYCRCVAGLGEIGFSRLYSALELEDPIVGQDTELASSLTLFMQKTNIIHDYLEDQLEGREFWPREVWSRHAEKLSDLAKPENAAMAVRCLNKMTTDALHHAPSVLKYLSRLKNKGVFNYWASLQVGSCFQKASASLAPQPHLWRGALAGEGMCYVLCVNVEIRHGDMDEYVFLLRTTVSRRHYSPISLLCAIVLVVVSWQCVSTMSKALGVHPG
uniref:Squalene synthase n=1 Tax=Crocodylus porosus TaxID=8502 RepID=A0A7M4E2H8_CROPO